MLLSGEPVKEYALAMIAGMWLADGVALLVVPRFIVNAARAVVHIKARLWPWQIVAMVAGGLLFWAGWDLRYQILWVCTATGMVSKALFLVAAPSAWQERVVGWVLAREDIDYRFGGLGLCTLAVLLLHALGWIGQG